MSNYCARCGSDHINQKRVIVEQAWTKPIGFGIFIGLLFILLKVLIVLSGNFLMAVLFLIITGFASVPLLSALSYRFAATLTGERPERVATCHNCGNEWHEKGACPPKQTAPSQSR